MSATPSLVDTQDPNHYDADMLRVMRAAAAFQARSVARTLKLSLADQADAEHEILLVLLERRRYFDPARGPWPPFVRLVARQAAQGLADTLMAARRLCPISMDELAASEQNRDDTTPVAEAFSDHTAPTESDMLDAISIASFVRRLPPELNVVVTAVLESDGELGEAQRATRLSTSEFYRRLREVRYRMFSLGMFERRRFAPSGNSTPVQRYNASRKRGDLPCDLLGNQTQPAATGRVEEDDGQDLLGNRASSTATKRVEQVQMPEQAGPLPAE
jgi:hypothetical protein